MTEAIISLVMALIFPSFFFFVSLKPHFCSGGRNTLCFFQLLSLFIAYLADLFLPATLSLLPSVALLLLDSSCPSQPCLCSATVSNARLPRQTPPYQHVEHHNRLRNFWKVLISNRLSSEQIHFR